MLTNVHHLRHGRDCISLVLPLPEILCGQDYTVFTYQITRTHVPDTKEYRSTVGWPLHLDESSWRRVSVHSFIHRDIVGSITGSGIMQIRSVLDQQIKFSPTGGGGCLNLALDLSCFLWFASTKWHAFRKLLSVMNEHIFHVNSYVRKWNSLLDRYIANSFHQLLGTACYNIYKIYRHMNDPALPL